MKNGTLYSPKLTSLVGTIRQEHQQEPPPRRDPISQVIFGFLQWNAQRRSAETAWNRIGRETVDHNELRVSRVPEIVTLLGANYPQAAERATRLREVLQEIFVIERALSLASLTHTSKKEVRAYLDSLPGMTPYVAAFVTLVSFEGHAMPVDDRLADLLRHHEVVDPEADLPQLVAFLERHIRAEHALATHAAIQAWVDAGSRRTRLRRAAGHGGAAAKTKKKVIRKKAST